MALHRVSPIDTYLYIYKIKKSGENKLFNRACIQLCSRINYHFNLSSFLCRQSIVQSSVNIVNKISFHLPLSCTSFRHDEFYKLINISQVKKGVLFHHFPLNLFSVSYCYGQSFRTILIMF